MVRRCSKGKRGFFNYLKTDDTLSVREAIANFAREKNFKGMNASDIDELLTANNYAIQSADRKDSLEQEQESFTS